MPNIAWIAATLLDRKVLVQWGHDVTEFWCEAITWVIRHEQRE